MTRIIGVVSGKGGVGKTTVVVNLGAALAFEFKKKVIIIDCNVTTSHLSLCLGMYYCPVTLSHVLKGEAKLSEAMYDYGAGLKVIPASLSIKDLEGMDFNRLKNVVRKLFGRADIILLDSAPTISAESAATVQASDEILFVSTPDIPSAMDIVRYKRLIEEKKRKHLGLVLNMVRRSRFELSRKEMEQLTELPVISTINFDEAVSESLALKMPLILNRPNSPAGREFNRLAAHILGEKIESKGLLQKIISVFSNAGAAVRNRVRA